MGKLVTILGACLVAAGGATYGLYTSREADDAATSPDCTLACGSCCGDSTPAASDETTPALAVAGPAGLFTTVPVKAEVGSKCSAKTFICCEEAPSSDNGLEAVAGSTAALARK